LPESLPSSVCVPELPQQWGEFYARVAELTGRLAKYTRRHLAETTSSEQETSRARFLLGTYAQLLITLETFDSSCQGVWLMKTESDFTATVKALEDLTSESPFSAGEQRWIAKQAAGTIEPAQVLDRIAAGGRDEIINRWMAWLKDTGPAGDEEGQQARVVVFATACETLARTLSEALP
jgi:hypothetical protein